MLPRLVAQTTAIIGLLFSAPLTVAALDAVEYKALLEKNKLKVGEPVQYVVVVDYGVGTMAPTISPPSFVQFEVLNEYQAAKPQGQGAEQYMTLKHFWLLKPSEPGRLSIASAIITYQDPTTNLLRNGKTDVVFADVAPADDEIPTPGDGAAVQPKRTKRNPFPMWLAWGGGGGAAAALLLLLLAVLSSGKKTPKLNHETAALEELQLAIAHVEKGDLSTYYAALSGALLDYLQNKFGLDAHVLATGVLLERLATFGIRRDMIVALEGFFKVADKTKFAGYLPDEDEMIILHGTVKSFIEAGRSIKLKAAKPKPKKKDDDD